MKKPLEELAILVRTEYFELRNTPGRRNNGKEFETVCSRIFTISEAHTDYRDEKEFKGAISKELTRQRKIREASKDQCPVGKIKDLFNFALPKKHESSYQLSIFDEPRTTWDDRMRQR